MIPKRIVPPELLRVAERQHWMLGRQQALAAGLSDRVISRLLGECWRGVAPGVYCVRDEPTWRGWCWAGLLLGGPDAVIGLAAAAHLHGFAPAPDEIAVWSGRAGRSRDHWPLAFIRGDRDAVGRPVRTDAVRTVLDLAARQRSDLLLKTLAEAVGRGHVQPAAIVAELATLPRHPRRALLRDVLAEVEQGVRSPLESRFLRYVERAHRLPRAQRQANPAGFDTDVWYRQYGVVIELDGRTFHGGAVRFRDLTRDNKHVLAGLDTLRYGWPDVAGQPCRVARQVVAVLRTHGWTGTPSDCPNCRGRRWV